nr:efflux RND transporter permease subunit [Phenylobacterium sp.]
MRSLPVTVLCTVGASLLVSLTIIPFLASRILSRHEDPEGNALLRWVNGGIHRLYAPLLHRALARPWTAFALIAAICATTLPMLGAIGSSLFPPADTPQFLVRIETADGTSLAKTDQALRFVERRLAAEPAIVWTAANLGRGNPQIFYNQQQRQTQTSYAEVFAGLKVWEPEASPRLLDALRADLAAYPGARISLVAFQNGPPIEAPLAVRISGENLDVLKGLAARAEQILKATPGTRDVGNPIRLDRTDLDLGVEEDKAAALGVSAGAVRRIARLALSGEETARFRDPDGDDYPVRVRLPMTGRNEISVLQDLYVPTQAGESAPFSALAEPRFRSSPAQITRFNRQRSVTLTSQIQTGFLTSAVTEDAAARLAGELALPPGYRLSLGGEAEAQSESFAGLGAAILVAIFGILAVLVLEFGKFRTALVVAGVIPLGLFGAVAALWVTGNSLSFTATIGLIALIGIEIKNSILLVDFTEQLRRQGVPLRAAIEQAGEVRFLPVLLTSVTAIGGLLPLALEGSGLYSPLAIAIMGGLITSTFLSRVATPVTYWLLSRGDETVDPAPTQAG